MLSTVLGDGLVALFGVPQAYEDHARRAVLAALAIQRRLKHPLSFGANPNSRQSARLSDHMRTALHTGWVAVARIGSGHDQRTTAVGETTAFAATIGQAAEPGTIVISDATARHVTGFVRLDPIGPVPVGKGEPVQIYRVTGAGPRRAPL